MSVDTAFVAQVTVSDGNMALPHASNGLGSARRLVDNVAYGLVAAALLFDAALVVIGVIVRDVFGGYFGVETDLTNLALTVIAFVGAATAYAADIHPSAFSVLRLWRKVADDAPHCVILLTAVFGITSSLNVLTGQWSFRTPDLGISYTWMDLPFTIGMGLVAVQACLRLLSGRSMATIGTLIVIVGVGIGLGEILASVLTTASMPWVLLICFVLLVASGVPIAFSLMGSALFALYVSHTAPLLLVPTSMLSGTSDFIMQAIPFFIFAGMIMAHSNLSESMIELIDAVLRRFRVRHGLMYSMIVSMFVFSGLSGSKVADAAAVGVPLSSKMRSLGYAPGESASVLIASSIMGETIPPSIAILVLGSVTTVSISALFVAGIIPAVLLGIAVSLTVFVRMRRQAGRDGSLDFHRRNVEPLSWVRITRGTVALTVPAGLVAAIVFGVGTPTEVSAIAALGALVVGSTIFSLDFRSFVTAIRETSALAGMILFIIMAASAFAALLTIAQVPQRLTTLVIGLSSHPAIFVLISIVVLMVLGTLLEGLPAIIIAAPLLVPSASSVGISSIQYSLVLILSIGLGAYLPPLGVGLYATCGLVKTSVKETRRPLIPYVVALLGGILVIAFVPGISLTLPRLLGLG